jgi:hypothetical protein
MDALRGQSEASGIPPAILIRAWVLDALRPAMVDPVDPYESKDVEMLRDLDERVARDNEQRRKK